MTAPDTRIVIQDKAREIFAAPDVFSQFEVILSRDTNSYLQSAMIVISDNPNLLECTPQSLVKSALRSASLGLSLDPALRQAYMIPRKVKGVLTACFQPHYHGLYDLAVRTNKYRNISVMPIYEGEQVFENMQTGIHVWQTDTGLTASPMQRDGLQLRNVTSGKQNSPVIGYLGYFKTFKGFEKSVWMTIKEIHAHAQKWAPDNYKSQYGAWQDEKKRPYMEMKTVFLALSKFMDLSGSDNSKLKEAIEAETIDSVAENIEETLPGEIVQTAERPEATYHDTPDVIEWKPAQIQAMIKAGAGSAFAAKGRLGLSCLLADATDDQIQSWGWFYTEKRGDPNDKANKVTSSEAAEYANGKWNEVAK